MRPARTESRPAAAARATLAVLTGVWLVGCRDLADAFAALIERLLLLAAIAFGLGLLACLGILGMTISAFRNRPPATRLVLSTLLGLVAVIASLACVLVLDTLGPIEAVFVLIPIPAVVWVMLTWGEFIDHRKAPPGRPPGSSFRTTGLLVSVGYLAAILALVWSEHGRPSWSEMFPPVSPDVPTVPIGEAIFEIHERSSPPVALTESGRMLTLEGSRARIHPGLHTSVVTGEDVGACALSSEGAVSCVGGLDVDAVEGKVDALAMSKTALCSISRGAKAIRCRSPAGAKGATITPAIEATQLALERERLFVLGRDQVLLEFSATTGEPGPLRLEGIRSVFTGGDAACFIGDAGGVRCQRRGELRTVTVSFAATSGAVTDYVGCVVGKGGQLACWDEFSRAGTSTDLDEEAEAVWPGNTFYVTVKLGSDRFVRVNSDMKTDPIRLPTVMVSP